MALSKAIQFVHEFKRNPMFRAECNRIPSKSILLARMDFTESEFENAINMEHVKCQTCDEAEDVQQIKWWFEIF